MLKVNIILMTIFELTNLVLLARLEWVKLFIHEVM